MFALMKTLLTTSFQGLFFTSVVAYNGAMQPSAVACSDGVKFVKSAPRFLNISLAHARTVRSMSCTGPDQPWLINANLSRVRLFPAVECTRVCATNGSLADVQHLMVTTERVLEVNVSVELCRTLPILKDSPSIFMPTDLIRLQWVAKDRESDMEEVYVGIGRDPMSSAEPDILSFTPTHGYSSYDARHSGLGHGSVFFIFLKALSKAGSQTSLSLGPISIDFTPPEITQSLEAVLADDCLQLTWVNGTFRDDEQPTFVPLDVTIRLGEYDKIASVSSTLSPVQIHCLSISDLISLLY